MNAKNILIICLTLVLICGWYLTAAGEEAKPLQRVAVFPFESTTDQELAGKITTMIRSKIAKKKMFSQFDPYSFEDLLAVCPIKVKASSSADDVAKAAKDYLLSQYAIWGSVEIPEQGRYVLTICWLEIPKEGPAEKREKVYDTSAIPDPEDAPGQRNVIDPKYKLAGSVKDFVDEFHKITNVEPDFEALYARNWKKAPNLINDGTFDDSPNFPPTWQKMYNVIAFDPEPMINIVKDPDRPGNCIKFELNEYVAANNGLLCYSNWVDIEENATYRASYDVKSLGPTVKIFVKCYDEIGGQWREIYRKPKNCYFADSAWHTYTVTFSPWHHKYSPKRARIMLYAYWPKGTVYYDNIVLKKVKEPAKSIRVEKMDVGKDAIFYRDVSDEKLKDTEEDYESYKKD